MGRPLYLKLYLAFLGVLLAIVLVSAGIAALLARSFPLVRGGPRVALHLARSLPAPDDLPKLQREVAEASDELGLDVTVVGLDGKELAHAGLHIDAPAPEQLSRMNAPGWVAPGLVSAPLHRLPEASAALAADERKKALAAEHAHLNQLTPPPPRFEGPPGPDRAQFPWEPDSWNTNDPPLAIVLVRVPVPGNPTQVWGVRTLFLLVLALLVSAALLYPLSRSITRPLERLADVSAAYGRGDFSQRSGIKGGDEVGRLASSFDEMAGRIERARRAEKELLANVSHELRTPLARLTVAIELIEPPPGPASDSMRKRLHGLSEEIGELTNLVSDVLTQSRLELADVPLTRRRVVVREMLTRCCERALSVDPMPIELDAPEGLAVLADETLLKRVIDNLIDNARKYANDPGPDEDKRIVTLSARAEGNLLLLAVLDRGPGFPLEDLSHVFDPFFRGTNAGGRSGGYGLGLALAKRVAEAHGGTISASNREGGGAKLELKIPGLEA